MLPRGLFGALPLVVKAFEDANSRDDVGSNHAIAIGGIPNADGVIV